MLSSLIAGRILNTNKVFTKSEYFFIYIIRYFVKYLPNTIGYILLEKILICIHFLEKSSLNALKFIEVSLVSFLKIPALNRI